MNLFGFPLWGLAASIMLGLGVPLALIPGPAKRRLVGLVLCQCSVALTVFWGWGVFPIGAGGEVAPPTSDAASWVLLFHLLLSLTAAWILGRRTWSEGLLASRSPRPGFRRNL